MVDGQIERALRSSGAPVEIRATAGTVNTHGLLTRSTEELFDGDRQSVTRLTVPVSAADGVKEGDKVEVQGKVWTVASVESNLHTATVMFRESERARR